jgi:prepilin-type N-terminal cleavage/methylation domain-containing protein
MTRPRAFTLIEMLAAVALLAVLTAAVTVSLAGAARKARTEDVAEQFAAFERATRDAARRFERTPVLEFDLNRGTIRRTDGERDAMPLHLAGGVRVKRLISGGRDVTYGDASVRFSALGQSPTYAVLLDGPGGQRLVAFAGLTGQSIVSSDERQVRDILSAAAGNAADRTDAR